MSFSSKVISCPMQTFLQLALAEPKLLTILRGVQHAMLRNRKFFSYLRALVTCNVLCDHCLILIDFQMCAGHLSQFPMRSIVSITMKLILKMYHLHVVEISRTLCYRGADLPRGIRSSIRIWVCSRFSRIHNWVCSHIHIFRYSRIYIWDCCCPRHMHLYQCYKENALLHARWLEPFTTAPLAHLMASRITAACHSALGCVKPRGGGAVRG